jgi:hypothetical protein
MNPEEDPLRSLPPYDVDPRLSEHIRRRAHWILSERRRRLSHPVVFWWSTCYHRVLEPAVLIGLGLGYLALTVQETVALFH